jgi:hypothetical protein
MRTLMVERAYSAALTSGLNRSLGPSLIVRSRIHTQTSVAMSNGRLSAIANVPRFADR